MKEVIYIFFIFKSLFLWPILFRNIVLPSSTISSGKSKENVCLFIPTWWTQRVNYLIDLSSIFYLKISFKSLKMIHSIKDYGLFFYIFFCLFKLIYIDLFVYFPFIIICFSWFASPHTHLDFTFHTSIIKFLVSNWLPTICRTVISEWIN